MHKETKTNKCIRRRIQFASQDLLPAPTRFEQTNDSRRVQSDVCIHGYCLFVCLHLYWCGQKVMGDELDSAPYIFICFGLFVHLLPFFLLESCTLLSLLKYSAIILHYAFILICCLFD